MNLKGVLEGILFVVGDDGVTLKYIPFAETRNYVHKVNKHWESYKNICK